MDMTMEKCIREWFDWYKYKFFTSETAPKSFDVSAVRPYEDSPEYVQFVVRFHFAGGATKTFRSVSYTEDDYRDVIHELALFLGGGFWWI